MAKDGQPSDKRLNMNKLLTPLACLLIIGSLSALTTTGTVNYDGTYTVVTFTSNGTINISTWINATVLCVGGGGGGGSNYAEAGGGGGGAGGLIYNNTGYNATGNISVVVGAGGAVAAGSAGAQGKTGENSSFGTLNCLGGGGGGTYAASEAGGNGSNGANGGGGGQWLGSGGNGTAGYDGGADVNGIMTGGGGGANGTGQNGSTGGGGGGNGSTYSINGTSVCYAGGGGGGTHSSVNFQSTGGCSSLSGGRGAGGTPNIAATAGLDGTGGGGGGGDGSENGKSGGSGIVIIRFLSSEDAGNLTLTVNCGVGGSSCLGNNTSVTVPANLSVNATAVANYTFVNWTTSGNCSAVNASANITNITMLSGSCIATANFYTPSYITCGNFGTAGQTYTLNATLNGNGTTCITVTDDNITIDCNGYSIIGNGLTTYASPTWGIFSDRFNTTIRNCNISKFNAGIMLYQAQNSTVNNCTLSPVNYTGSPNGLYPSVFEGGLIIWDSVGNSVNNTTMAGGYGASLLQLSINSNWNSLNWIDITHSAAGSGAIINCGASNNSLSNFIIRAESQASSADGLDLNTASDNTFTNFTIINSSNADGQGSAILLESQCVYGAAVGTRRNKFINGTLIGASYQSTGGHVNFYDSNPTDNIFYLMNFTPTTGPYVQGATSGNWFNSSTEGNIWADVANGSVNITGNVSSSIAGYYIGFNGTGYPYSSAVSSKIPTGVIDWHPLTPFLYGGTPIYANLTVLMGSGGSATTGNATNFNIPASKSITATALSNHTFSNWTKTGTCTITNNLSSSTIVSITTNETCIVTANFLQKPSSLTVLAGTGGSAIGNNSSFAPPKTFIITATAGTNYTFNNWTTTTGTCLAAQNLSSTIITINAIEACIIQANFLYTPITLDYGTLIVLCGVNGLACYGNASNFTVPATMPVFAIPATNYSFLSWSIVGNCSATSSAATLITNGTCTITANFIYSQPSPPAPNPSAYTVPDPHITGTISLLGFMNTITGGIFGIGIIIALSIIIFMSLFDRGFEEALLVASMFATLIGILCAWMGIVSPLWIVLFLAITCVAVILNMRKRG